MSICVLAINRRNEDNMTLKWKWTKKTCNGPLHRKLKIEQSLILLRLGFRMILLPVSYVKLQDLAITNIVEI